MNTSSLIAIIVIGAWSFVISIIVTLFLRRYSRICKLDLDISKKYRAFTSPPLSFCQKVELYIGGIFLLPIRIVAIPIIILLWLPPVVLGLICADSKKGFSACRRAYLKAVFQFNIFLLQVTFGLVCYSKIHKLIKQYDPTYPEAQYAGRDKSHCAPMIISNHTSWLDTLVIGFEYLPSYLGKKDVAKYPVIGTLGRALLPLYVDRSNQAQKELILHQIKERMDTMETNKGFPPLTIFPEGTRTNNSVLIQFKKGAFFSFSPIKMLCLKYSAPNYELNNGIWPLLRIFNRIKLYEFENFYPDHLAKTEEHAWEGYAHKCREIMARCLEVPMDESSFPESLAFKNYLKGMENEKNNEPRKFEPLENV